MMCPQGVTVNDSHVCCYLTVYCSMTMTDGFSTKRINQRLYNKLMGLEFVFKLPEKQQRSGNDDGCYYINSIDD